MKKCMCIFVCLVFMTVLCFGSGKRSNLFDPHSEVAPDSVQRVYFLMQLLDQPVQDRLSFTCNRRQEGNEVVLTTQQPHEQVKVIFDNEQKKVTQVVHVYQNKVLAIYSLIHISGSNFLKGDEQWRLAVNLQNGEKLDLPRELIQFETGL